VAGMLHVSHFLMLTERRSNVNLRVARVPRGPTLSFRVHNFARARDIVAAQKRPADVAQAYRFPPLVVLNGFSSGGALGGEKALKVSKSAADNALQTMQITLQGMFPTINVRNVQLKQCRRVVLFHRDKGTGLVQMRHYLVRAAPVGASRGVRKLNRAKVPNLGALDDVADYVLSGGRAGVVDGGLTSDSEFEDESARVTLPQAFSGKGNKAAARSAVKLTELGPRMTLELLKIEAGLGEGEVLYHARMHKSAEETLATAQRHAVSATVKAARQAAQADNVAAKQAAKDAKSAAKKARRAERIAALRDGEGGEGGLSSDEQESGDYDTSDGDDDISADDAPAAFSDPEESDDGEDSDDDVDFAQAAKDAFHAEQQSGAQAEHDNGDSEGDLDDGDSDSGAEEAAAVPRAHRLSVGSAGTARSHETVLVSPPTTRRGTKRGAATPVHVKSAAKKPRAAVAAAAAGGASAPRGAVLRKRQR